MMSVYYDASNPMSYIVTDKVRSEFSERVYFDLTTEVAGW
jgi:hypothetical protein